MSKIDVKFTKIITIVLLLLILGCIFGACNQQVIDTTYKYNRAIIKMGDEYVEVQVSSWKDYDDSDSIQIKTTDGTSYYTHLNNVVLIAD